MVAQPGRMAVLVAMVVRAQETMAWREVLPEAAVVAAARRVASARQGRRAGFG